jgi:TRAP-type mannitol/chloroaromatic compound transport system substrate-binding protein
MIEFAIPINKGYRKMKSRLFLSLAALSAASVIALSSGVAAAQEKIQWRMQTIAAPNTSEYNDLAQAFADRVGVLSGGRMEIKVFGSGVLSGELEAGNAVAKGVFELWHSYTELYASKAPEFRSSNEWPVNADRLQAAMWYYAGGSKFYRDALIPHNLHHLGVTPVAGEHIWSKIPLRSVDDMKGLKIRSGGVASRSFKILGASPVSMSGSDVYQGLQRGVVDAAEWTTLTVNYGFGLHEVTKYVVMPSYSGGSTYDWVSNLDAWKSLPDDLKEIVESALHEVGFKYWMKVKAEESRVLQELEEKGIEIIYWSDEDMRKLDEARMQVVGEMYTKDTPEYAVIMRDQFEFLESLGYDVPDKYMTD